MHRLRSPGTEAAFVSFLFALNAFLIWPLFSVEYPASFYSIEGAYIALARFIQEQIGNLQWYPYWYGGIPFPSTYPPFSHFLTAGWASLSGASVALSYHQTSAAIYCLIPVATYLLARSLRAERWPAFSAALLASLISPSLILFPPMAGDVGAWNFARRLQVLITYGEGPHNASLLMCLVALALFNRALVIRRAIWFVLASAGCAATALTNWLGAVALATGILASLLAQEEPFSRRNWMLAVGMGILAYGLAGPWLPPSTIAAIRRNAPHIGGRYEPEFATLLAAIGMGVLLLLVIAVLRAIGANRVLRFSILWTAILGTITTLAIKVQLFLLPQSERYHIELEIPLLLLLVLGGYWLLNDALDKRRLAQGFLALVALACALQIPVYRGYATRLIQSSDGDASIEAQSARWFAKNLPGKRVYLSGSVAFWANAFADVQQFAGAFDNGIQNPNTLGAIYQILSSEGAGDKAGEIATIWLKAYGVHAIQVSFPDTPEAYHPFRIPEKFEGVLERIWEHRGMVSYRVPLRHGGLAFVVPESALPTRPPYDGLDIEEAKRYVASLDDSTLPIPKWNWVETNRAEIDVSNAEGQVISVQIAYHPGWEARSETGTLPVEGDALGQIVLRPRPGTHHITMEFTGGAEMQVLRVMFVASLLAAAGLLYADWRRNTVLRARKHAERQWQG